MLGRKGGYVHRRPTYLVLLLCRGCSGTSLHGNHHRRFDVTAERENRSVTVL
jgi:hypothetical protein